MHDVNIDLPFPANESSSESACSNSLNTADPVVALLEGIGDGFYAIDRDWQLTYVNGLAEAYFAAPRGDLVGRVIWDVLPWQANPRLRQVLEATMTTRRLTLIDAEAMVIPGRKVEFRVFAYGKGLGIAFRDRTEELLTQTSLAESEEKLRLAVGATKLGLWDFDMRTGRLIWSDELKTFYGLPPDTEVDYEKFRQAIHPEDLGIVFDTYEAAFNPEGDGRFGFQHRLVQPSGTVRWLEAYGRVIFDADRRPCRAIGFSADITDRKHDEERLQVLVAELNHRVKNAMAVAQAIVNQTLRSTKCIGEAKEALNGRFNALGSAIDLLNGSNWAGGDLRDLVGLILSGFVGRFDLDGPDLTLTPRATQTMSLVLYELTSNAAKHGALSAAEGRVCVKWALTDNELSFEWREENGPPTEAPTRQGFGSMLLKRVASAELEGRVALDFDPKGLRYSIAAPAKRILNVLKTTS